MEQDSEQFKEVEQLLSMNSGSNVMLKRCASFCDAKENIDGDTVVIADEFDYQLFDKNEDDPFELF